MKNVEAFGIIPFKKESGLKVLLVLHHEGDYWGFPKGRPEPDESPMESARRELKEETGLDVLEWIQPDPLIEHYQFQLNAEIIEKTVYYFVAWVKGEVRRQAEEIAECQWVNAHVAVEYLSTPARQNLYNQALHATHEFHSREDE